MIRHLAAALPLAALLLIPLNANAEEAAPDAPKLGFQYAPVAGDCALGFDAVPVLNYFGNAFNNHAGNTVFNGWAADDHQIVAKYFTADDTAFRIRARIGVTSLVEREAIADDTPSEGQPLDTNTDVMYTNSFEVNLAAGMEKRRGHHRVQGFYGAEALLRLGGERSYWTYGNAITEENPAPTTYDFEAGFATSSAIRPTEARSGVNVGLGARAFAGAEFFVTHGVSVSSEFGWGAMLNATGAGKVDMQFYDAGAEREEDDSLDIPADRAFVMDTDNFTGSITLNAYF